MELSKPTSIEIDELVPIVITNRHGESEIKNFRYTEHAWYEENDNGLYSFDFDMHYDWHAKTFTCPQKYLSPINHWSKQVGSLRFCVCGEHGITAFINTFDGKFPKLPYIKHWFWKKYKKVFWAVATNKYI